MDLEKFPRIALAHLPTPFEPLDRLRAELGGPRLYVKRDDCTGLAFGGNKTRKLEFLLAEALAQDADTVITTGGLQSNHVRQTAAAAAKLGLRAELVLTRNVPWTADNYDQTGNIQLDRLLGARLHVFPAGTDRAAAMTDLADRLSAKGRRPYVIPLGGSNEIGMRGYLNGARELLSQAEAAIGGLEVVVLATSSGGTQAGLTAGLRALGSPARVIGVDVDANPDEIADTVRGLVTRSAEQLGLDAQDIVARVEVAADYAGAGYGLPTPEMIEAVSLMASLEGLILDPVYSGKAMAGLVDMVRNKRFGAEDRVVFLHSGGTPALFAYRSAFAETQHRG